MKSRIKQINLIEQKLTLSRISVAAIVMIKQNICIAYGIPVFSARYTDKLSGANISIKKNLTTATITRPTIFSVKYLTKTNTVSNIQKCNLLMMFIFYHKGLSSWHKIHITDRGWYIKKYAIRRCSSDALCAGFLCNSPCEKWYYQETFYHLRIIYGKLNGKYYSAHLSLAE